jgi:hypothetical protein
MTDFRMNKLKTHLEVSSLVQIKCPRTFASLEAIHVWYNPPKWVTQKHTDVMPTRELLTQ